MSLHVWEAIHDATVRSEPLFDIEPDMVESQPPSLQRVLLAAATLWCRHLVWPSVRDIASTAAVAASTSIKAAGSSSELRMLLIEAEAQTVLNLAEARFAGGGDHLAVAGVIGERMQRLASIDPALRRLPLMTALASDHPQMEVLTALAYARNLVDDRPSASAVA